MRLVMLAEQHVAREPVESATDVVAHPQLVVQPERQGHEIRPETPGRVGGVGLEQAIEFDERFLVKADQIESRAP